MEKKISFGFSKIAKKPQLVVPPKPQDEEKIELIESLEGSTINVIGKVDEEPVAPLVIPMTANTTPLEKVKQLREENRPDKEAKQDDVPVDESLEQRAAREIIENLKVTEEAEESASKFTVPLTADEVKLGGAKASSLDDYENVPIAQFGLAMLRGMGWKDEDNKQKKKSPEDDIVVCRPKGLGLGADKAMKQQVKLATQNANVDEKLVMKKGAFVRILAGKHKDFYGQIEGMDDESGRVFVKLALGGKRESVNEAFVLLVNEKEYKENRKVLNVSKYEEYKMKEGAGNSSNSAKEERSERYREKDARSDKYEGNGRNADRRRNDYDDDEKYSRRDDRAKKEQRRDRSRSRSPERRKDSSSSSSYRHKSGRDYDDDRRSHRERSASRERSSKYDDNRRRDRRRDGESSSSHGSSSKRRDR